ncbi:MAG: putative aminohydrolase SsnA [Candidatus Eisenbacteria bacterium]|nr:putative aminohydrolase SsnA [Candidatus Eisenbacteria bacterium]
MSDMEGSHLNGAVLAGGTVVTGGTEPRVIHDGAVSFREGRIESVGSAADVVADAAGYDVLDTTGKLVMPGLVNAHTHLYSTLARALVADLEPSSDFVGILEHLWWRLDKALTGEDVRLSAAAGAVDLLRNGTTTIVDHHASQTAVDGSLSQVADALSEIGLRANLCFETSDRHGRDARDAGLEENLRFARETSDDGGCSGAPMLTASVGLHASFTLEDETLDRASEMARGLGVGCHIHVAEDVADVKDSLERSGRRVVERLESHGILGPRTIAAHCIHVDGREVEILRDTGTIVVHNPESNMNNAVGCTDVGALLDEGVLVGLGTDGFSPSMFDEMKVANLVHRDRAGDPRVGHDYAGRLCLDGNGEITERLFGERLGELRPEAAADIVVLDYDPPTPVAGENFVGHVIFGLTGWMVEAVIVDGRQVVRNREVLTLDARNVMASARERARELWSRM